MTAITEKQESFVEMMGAITSNSAYVKFNEDQNWPVDYVRLGTEVYSNPSKLGDNIINYSRNVQEAIKLSREIKTVEQHEEHINPFIIKYHPSWNAIREQNGLLQIEIDEVPCQQNYTTETYSNLVNDDFTAIGIYTNLNDVKPDTKMTEKVFDSMFPPELVTKFINNDEQNHPDFTAFRKTILIKSYIDKYNELVANGINPKELDCDFKGVSYKLDQNGFPVLTMGSNKNKKTFDFRNPKATADFYKRLAARNKGTEFGQTYKQLVKNR